MESNLVPAEQKGNRRDKTGSAETKLQSLEFLFTIINIILYIFHS